ncbi:MAG: UPF0182 family protein [Clostridia bacterium]|nr:UPF0182 family protein [Clostridia bacterium]
MNESGKKNGMALGIGIVVLVVVLFLCLINFITDWMWFSELGYVSVFLKQLVTELEVGVPVFIVLALLLKLYLTRIKKGYFTKIVSHEATDMKKLNKITNWLSVIGAGVAAFISVSELWFKLLQFANASGFDIKDPLFNIDLSFYIFKLEFLTDLNEIVIGLIVGFIIITAIYYSVLISMHTPDSVFEQDDDGMNDVEEEEEERYTGRANPFGKAGETLAQGKLGKLLGGSRQPKKNITSLNDTNFKSLMHIASTQITVVGVLFFVMVGIDFFLKQFDLLHAHTGAVYGAGFTDVYIQLWIYRILAVLSIVGAVMTAIHIKKKEFRKIIRVPLIMVLVGVLGFAVSGITQSFVVSPDEINKEKPFLERNIKYTQLAYDLEDVTTKPYSASKSLTSADLDNNSETISNIRINDYSPVKTFYNQTQSIRRYYNFCDVDVDRYMIGGELTQTYLATREIDESKITDTWLNRHLKYTHGYGVTLSRVDTVTTSGQPDVLIGNIPSESSIADDITIKNNAVYFGEMTNDYILVNTDEKEFDYPDGDSNKYTEYDGHAGIKMNFINRLLFSIREGSFKMLVSSNIDRDSKIIINRNVVDRIQKIMPFLQYEDDPYLVTVNGNLYWMLDAYTTSAYYPYAEPYSGEMGSTNYIRNSIKVVVDAYNGDTNFYIVDKNDPIAQTYAKIYPKLFKDFSQMDKELQSHIRYPNTLFEIQASIYGRYHMKDVSVFYQNEDNWDLANEIYGTETVIMQPNYYIYKLPGESSAEFVSSVAYTPENKKNMTALFVARSDGDNYGKLVLYQFPKSKTVYGPEQVEAMIDQNTEISKEFSLWNSNGSKYSRGNLFIIPIEDSILYVEPVYLEATNSSIPEVKRVIVAFGDKIAYESTLGDALAELFGSSSVTENSNPAPGQQTQGMSQKQLINKVVEAYNNAQSAQKNGNWASYGKYLQEMENYLNQLQK